ncbi:MAG: class I SAM-dependent methyltransferase [Gammaproteobacteria bacterium]|nr:class I SAM-dependent methyltransferase [Gammaproteobacteria bacterium]
MLYKQLRRFLNPLVHTPLHPQWLVACEKQATLNTVKHWARGNTIDVGCGNRWLSEAVTDGSYIGLDYPPTVAQGYPGHPHVFGDAACLPFRDATADTVLLMDVLEHVRFPDLAIREAARILQPNGYLILQVPFIYPVHDAPNDFRRWTREGLRLLLKQPGFNIVDETAYGNPAETSAALGAIALAKSGLNTISQRKISVLLMPLIVILIPLVNVAGWLLGKVLPADTFMPLGYRLVAQKTA